jgi:hypothetical protein
VFIAIVEYVAETAGTTAAATVTVHVLAVETNEPELSVGVALITSVPAFVGVNVITSVLLIDAAAAADTFAVRAVAVSTVGVPRSVVAAVAGELIVTSPTVIPAGASVYDNATVIVSEDVSCKKDTVALTVTAVPTVVEAVAAERASVSACTAAFEGATERTPRPKAATATSATRLKVVFVDICFLSIVDPRTIRRSA